MLTPWLPEGRAHRWGGLAFAGIESQLDHGLQLSWPSAGSGEQKLPVGVEQNSLREDLRIAFTERGGVGGDRETGEHEGRPPAGRRRSESLCLVIWENSIPLGFPCEDREQGFELAAFAGDFDSTSPWKILEAASWLTRILIAFGLMSTLTTGFFSPPALKDRPPRRGASEGRGLMCRWAPAVARRSSCPPK